MSARGIRRAGMTLLELVVAIAIFVTVLTLAFGSFTSTAQMAAVTSSLTDAQLEAERLARAVREELRASGVGGPGGLVIKDTNPADPELEVEYTPLDPEAPIFDPAAPYAPPFLAERRVIKFQPDGLETLGNGVDDDGDRLVDEGQLALYRRGTTDELIGQLGANVGAFSVVLDANPAPYPRVWISVTVERLIPTAPDAGGKVPSTRHTAQAMVTLLN